MILIKDTIARVGKALQNAQAIAKSSPSLSGSNSRKFPTQHSTLSVSNPLSLTPPLGYEKCKATPNRSKLLHQDFLRPLNMPSLKTFDDAPVPYDVQTATENWRYKPSARRKNASVGDSVSDVAANIQRRRQNINFERMVDIFFSMTPQDLKATTTHQINQVLEKHTNELARHRYPVVRHRFDAVPDIPDPLTPQSFEKYIYTLTHLIFHGNSENLQAISKTLLDTHRLPGEYWKEFRLEITYNYLIKYFGYDKNQSAFARQLLLVMHEDGCNVNTDTINHLIKICRTHSQIRSKMDTFLLVIKCLKLAKDFRVEINLSTFTRIFDTIADASLRRTFLVKMKVHNIPLLRGMIYRILDDMSDECASDAEFIQRMETVIDPTDWMHDPIIVNKLVRHRARLATAQDVSDIYLFVCDNRTELTTHTLKLLIGGISLNKSLGSWKEFFMMSAYFQMLQSHNLSMAQAPGVYGLLVSGALASDLPGIAKNFLIRGILHEASIQLGLSRRKKQNFVALNHLLGGPVSARIRNLELINDSPINQEFHGSERECWDRLQHDLLCPVLDQLEMCNIVHRFITTCDEKMKERGIKKRPASSDEDKNVYKLAQPHYQ